jgi:MFS family permease
LIAVPQGIGGLLRGIVGPRLLERIGLKRFLAANCLLAAVSIALVLRTPTTSRYPLLGIALLGVGFGSTNIIFGSAVAGSAGVADEEQGLASALLNATRQVGAAVGVAVMLSIVASQVGGETGSAALAGGYRLALLVSAGLAVLGAFVTLALPAGTTADARRGRTAAQPARATGVVPTR